MQRLNDVTGDPIRLSATQREQQREAMIAMLNAQTRQINTLTATVRTLQDRLDGVDRRFNEQSQAVCQMFYGRSLWMRLRWIVRGV